LLGLELRKEDIKHLRGVGGGEVPVLGRTDVFDRFKIMFNQGSRSIIFEESNKT
jgi:hypothetical protein